ncbi:MAG: M28 family peptidase, partial [Myxococcaceae bacterium]
VQSSWTGEQFELPQSGSEPRLQVKAWTTEDATKKLLGLAGKDLNALRAAAEKRDFKPVPLGIRLTTEFKTAIHRAQTANVLGKLPGRDSKLSPQMVMLTAHHDHLGRKGSEIYNGAVDNASGVATMLAVARAVTSLPGRPRRTVLFAALAGEEQGLLGSEFLSEHPPAPLGALAADINIDGINIWGRTRDLTVIGLGKSSLDPIITALATAQNRTVKPDQLSDRGFFYRSDQFNFAKVGVPSAYFGSGMDFVDRPEQWGKEQRELWEKKHYHQTSDDVTPAWDLSGAVEDAQLYFQLAIRVANADAMPTWKKGDEFEAARLRALEGKP